MKEGNNPVTLKDVLIEMIEDDDKSQEEVSNVIVLVIYGNGDSRVIRPSVTNFPMTTIALLEQTKARIIKEEIDPE